MRAICLKHGPAYDVARNSVRDLALGWIHTGWIRYLVIDYPDGFFYIARDQNLLQNTCRIVQSAVARRTPFIFLGPWVLWEQPYSLASLFVKSIQRAWLDHCQFGTPWRKRTAVLSSLIDTRHCTDLHFSNGLFLVPPPSCPSRQRQRKRYLNGPAHCSPTRNHIQVCGPHLSTSRIYGPCAPILVFVMYRGQCMFLSRRT